MRFLMMAVLLGMWSNGGFAETPLDEGAKAYASSPFASFSQDYFERFSRDPNAVASEGEVTIGPDWEIVVRPDADPLTALMAGHLAEFLKQRMDLDLPVKAEAETDSLRSHRILLTDGEGESNEESDECTLEVTENQVRIQANNPQSVRDGVVQFVDRIGFRAAPILEKGSVTYKPRLGLRIGAVPWMGSYRDVAFLGCNGVILTAGKDTRKKAHSLLTALSTSDAIEELADLRDPELLKQLAENAKEARRYGLKTFLPLRWWDFYPADAAIFENHPGLRGAEVYHHVGQPPAGHILCTEDPLMRRYLMESIQGLFRIIPLDGVLIIIGGENFQHCYMRPADVEKGHTNCARCEKLGAETVVANLCNSLAEAARSVNPEGLVVAWPYSASYFWSVDDDQAAFIQQLGPGTAILSEIEKDERVAKEGVVDKLIWDYSIDLIGPTSRALRQIAACRARGIPVYFKSEPELAFEAPGLPYIPCLDRWFDRAEALVTCGADGAWVFPWFQACYGTTSAEVYKYAWWEPSLGKEAILGKLSQRIAGPGAAKLLREAWGHVSEAVPCSPEQPPYFSGPYYLGPAHPMCADPAAELPEIFRAKGKFGLHVLSTPTGDTVHFGSFYRRMEQALLEAVSDIELAGPLVPERCQPTFRNEVSVTRWFYHTARTHANFYESCLLRSFLLDLANQKFTVAGDLATAQAKYDRWRKVLEDERANTLQAISVVEQDPRLDFRNGMGTALANAPDLMRAKLNLLDQELNVFLPSIARKCELKPDETLNEKERTGTMRIPRISGEYIHVYQPEGDVFPGPSATPLEAGKYYDEWVVNDHCVVRDQQGRWHIIGITHPASGVENVHAGEYQSFHALAPEGSLNQVLVAGAWKDQPKILPPSERPGEMPENHAPCMAFVDGVYHMIYGPAPLRRATSLDLVQWTPLGPLQNSLVTRDPSLLFWSDQWHLLTCGVSDVRMATLDNFCVCGESKVILETKPGVDPESPTLVPHAGTFYLFVCDWNGVWDRKDLRGAYQHITRVYQSDDPFHFDASREIAQIEAHAPEIFQGEGQEEWYISSAEWPYRGISIAPLEWIEIPLRK